MPLRLVRPAAGLVLLPALLIPGAGHGVHTARPGAGGVVPVSAASPSPASARVPAAAFRATMSVGRAAERVAVPATRAGWRFPLAGRPSVVQRFSVGPEVWSPGHRGVDLGAAPGSTVLAPAAGVVTFAGVVVDRPVLVLRHPEGHVTSLEPVIATVPVGSEVAAGDPVGRLSPVPGHCAPVGCLHWGERIGGRYVDPLSLLGLAVGPVILLPLRN